MDLTALSATDVAVGAGVYGWPILIGATLITVLDRIDLGRWPRAEDQAADPYFLLGASSFAAITGLAVEAAVLGTAGTGASLPLGILSVLMTPVLFRRGRVSARHDPVEDRPRPSARRGNRRDRFRAEFEARMRERADAGCEEEAYEPVRSALPELRDAMRILGVRPGAPAHEVRAAWKRLVRANHPDCGGTAADMARINLAYEILREGAPA